MERDTYYQLVISAATLHKHLNSDRTFEMSDVFGY